MDFINNIKPTEYSRPLVFFCFICMLSLSFRPRYTKKYDYTQRRAARSPQHETVHYAMGIVAYKIEPTTCSEPPSLIIFICKFTIFFVA